MSTPVAESNSALRDVINKGDMTPFQVMAVAICFFLNFLDGLDLLALAYTAPAITEYWQVEPDVMGYVFSASLAGMTLGALFLAPFADMIGRQKSLLIALVIIAIGLFWTSMSGSPYEMIAARFVTGLGIGIVLASSSTMAAEYSSDKRRALSISIVGMGYPVGSFVGGFLAGLIIPDYGWRAVFQLCGLITTLTIIPVFFLLPESIDFLLHKRPRQALAKVNRVLSRLGKETIDRLPDLKPEDEDHAAGFKALMEPAVRVPTLMLWIGFFSVFVTYYFMINWLPQVVVSEGGSLWEGIGAGAIFNVGGVLGMLLLGLMAPRLGLHRMLLFFLVGSIVFMTVFGYAIGSPILLVLGILFLCGFFLQVIIIGHYTMSVVMYEARVRNTGLGWGIGMGRFGAMLGPIIAGYLIKMGWTPEMFFAAMTLPLFVCILSVRYLGRLKQGQ